MPTRKKIAYVALLRGINVGGNNIVKMAALKELFEQLGFSEVRTFINSGNVIFRASQADSAKLTRKIEAAITKATKLKVRVTLRSLADYEKMLNAFPKNWGTNAKQRHYVLFLFPDLDRKDVIKDFALKPDIEQAWYVKGAVLWSTNLDALTRTALHKVIGVPKLYQGMTIRNANSTRKIHDLLVAADQAS